MNPRVLTEENKQTNKQTNNSPQSLAGTVKWREQQSNSLEHVGGVALGDRGDKRLSILINGPADAGAECPRRHQDHQDRAGRVKLEWDACDIAHQCHVKHESNARSNLTHTSCICIIFICQELRKKKTKKKHQNTRGQFSLKTSNFTYILSHICKQENPPGLACNETQQCM